MAEKLRFKVWGKTSDQLHGAAATQLCGYLNRPVTVGGDDYDLDVRALQTLDGRTFSYEAEVTYVPPVSVEES